jgi:hypothetical protein
MAGRLLAVALLSLAAAAAGCGGGGRPQATATTAQARSAVTASERLWRLQVERFAAGLLPELRRLEQLTGGSRKTGVAGVRLDPRIFTPGRVRRSFTTTMAGLSRCGHDLDAAVPPAPTRRLRPVRVAFSHACGALAEVPVLIRSNVLEAGSAGEVDRDLLAVAARRAGDGVRLLADGLAILRRALG